NDRMRDQILRDLGGDAIDEIDHASRNACIREASDELSWRCGRLFRGLDDDRASSRKRAGNLANRLVDREIPRREPSHRTNGLFQDELIDALGARRNDTAIGTLAFLGE